MPELPEAETIARDLDRRIAGSTIARVTTHHHDVIAGDARHFARAVTGRTFAGAGRRGKNVVLRMRDGARLVVNLGMTGRLVLSDAPRAGELRHIAVAFDLDDGRSLLYDDARRFGLLQLYDAHAWPARDAELGIEPLDDAFTGEALRRLTRRTRVPVRNFLLDQTKIAGVGNIYALEALFRAGIRPTRRARTLTRAEVRSLRDELRAVLEQAIDNRGTTFSDYRDGTGESGAFAPLLRVYGREGEPCVVCGTAIKRKVLTTRSAFYCPSCQS